MYAWWVYHLSKLRIVTGFIGFCTITQLVGALGIGIANQEAGTIMKSQPRFKAFQIIWTLFNVASDILIAGTMTWLLLASRGWKNEGERSTVVTKIVRFTVETNVASSAVAIAMFLTMVIPSIGPPKGVFFLTPGYVLGKLYVVDHSHSNSFMAMLNNRSLIKRDIIRNQIDHPSSRQQQWNQGVVQRAAVTLPAASFSHDDVRPPGSYIPTDFKRRDTEDPEYVPQLTLDAPVLSNFQFLGILLNTWLLGVLTLQYYLYYVNFPEDRWILKLTAHFLFLIEVAQTLFSVADGWHRYVVGFGDMNIADDMFLANFDTPIMDAIIALVVQGMYAWRVYHLSKLKWLTALICFFAVSQCVGGLVNGIINNALHKYSHWKPSYFPVQVVWTVSSAVADCLIAGAMSWLLLKESKGLRSYGVRNSMLVRIMTLTIETNLASATMAILLLIMVVAPSIAPPKQNYFLAPAYILGKLYVPTHSFPPSLSTWLNLTSFPRRDMAQGQFGAMSGGSRQLNLSNHQASISLHNTTASSTDPVEIKRTVETFRLNDFKTGDSVNAV
ncbi:hypothetical protein AN958_05714 [Leucoagaricus sp. SymC.cos]|nr:hypothetical protein AN958_05714 [Leucoagaricus sp. SymC.cos]